MGRADGLEPTATLSALAPRAGGAGVTSPDQDLETDSLVPALPARDAVATRSERPPSHSSRPGSSGLRAHPSAPSGATSELERRNDFSMILSSADSPEPPPENAEERLGQVLGSYRLVEVIGRGGMGCVYRAEHVKLGRDVALKLLRRDYARRRDAVARFFQEARAVNLIRHRNIVDIIDYIELDDGTVFIIMELLAGRSLGRLMRGGPDLPAARCLGLLLQICEGLAAAHAVGVVHRDLKPDNIIVVPTADGGDLVKILDFGVAKLIDRQEADPELTQVGAVIGTPAYMSPEQAGGLQVDQRSDLYTLGAIMYELFTKQLVFRADSFGDYVRMHLSEEPTPPSQMSGGANIDPRLEAVIMRCLQKSPSARFQSATDLRAELAGLAAELEPQLMNSGIGMISSVSQGWSSVSNGFSQAASGRPVLNGGSSGGGLGVEAAGQPGPSGESLPSGGSGSPSSGSSPWSARQTPPPDALAYGTPSPYGPPTPDPLGRRDSGSISVLPEPRWPTFAIAAFAVATVVVLVLILSNRGGSKRHAKVANVSPTHAAAVVDRSAGGAGGDEAASGHPSAVPGTGTGGEAAGGEATGGEATGGEATGGEATGPNTGTPQARPLTGAGASSGASGDGAGAATGPDSRQTSPQAIPGTLSGDSEGAGGSGASASAGSDPQKSDPANLEPRHRSGSHERAAAGSPIKVRIVSRPSGKLYQVGRRGELCETPCAITINPRDGGSSKKRSYVVKRHGYKDAPVVIDLSQPPKRMVVQLDRVTHKGSGKKGGGQGNQKLDPEATFNPFANH